MPIRTTMAVYLMVSLAVYTFEDMGTWLLHLDSQLIKFLIFHTIPYLLSIVFSQVSSIILCASGSMRATVESQVFLFLAVLVLWNPRVHIGTMNGSDILSNIKTLIDDVLHQRTTLRIPDIYPYHYHVEFGRCFNNTQF